MKPAAIFKYFTLVSSMVCRRQLEFSEMRHPVTNRTKPSIWRVYKQFETIQSSFQSRSMVTLTGVHLREAVCYHI